MDVESPYFLMFSAKRSEIKIDERDGHEKSRNGHGKVMEKYFVKSVGTLIKVGVENILNPGQISLLSCIRFTLCHVPKSTACPDQGKKSPCPIGLNGLDLIEMILLRTVALLAP